MMGAIFIILGRAATTHITRRAPSRLAAEEKGNRYLLQDKQVVKEIIESRASARVRGDHKAVQNKKRARLQARFCPNSCVLLKPLDHATSGHQINDGDNDCN